MINKALMDNIILRNGELPVNQAFYRWCHSIHPTFCYFGFGSLLGSSWSIGSNLLLSSLRFRKFLSINISQLSSILTIRRCLWCRFLWTIFIKIGYDILIRSFMPLMEHLWSLFTTEVILQGLKPLSTLLLSFLLKFFRYK